MFTPFPQCTVRRILLYPVFPQFRAFSAKECADNYLYAVSFPLLFQTLNDFFRFRRHIFFHIMLQTVPAFTAGVRVSLPKIAQNTSAQARLGITVKNHGLEPFLIPLPNDTLFIQCKVSAVFLIFQQKSVNHNVLRRIQKNTIGRFAVSSGATRFLIVVFHALGHVIMQYVAHIGFINPHSESVGCHDHGFSVIDKIILIIPPLLRGQSRVVSCDRYAFFPKLFVHFLHIFSGSAVYDAALLPPIRHIMLQIARAALRMLHRKEKILPVKACHKRLGIFQSQHRDNILPDLIGGCGSKRT